MLKHLILCVATLLSLCALRVAGFEAESMAASNSGLPLLNWPRTLVLSSKFNKLYVVNFDPLGNSNITECNSSSGSLKQCTTTRDPTRRLHSGSYATLDKKRNNLYVAQYNIDFPEYHTLKISICNLNGTSGSGIKSSDPYPTHSDWNLNGLEGIALDAETKKVYIANFPTGMVGITICDYADSGFFTCCYVPSLTRWHIEYPRGLAINTKNEKLYVADDHGHSITVCTLGTKGVIIECSKPKIKWNMEWPQAVAYDSASHNLYVVSDRGEGITRCSLDSTGFITRCTEVNLPGKFSLNKWPRSPWDVEVDAKHRQLYAKFSNAILACTLTRSGAVTSCKIAAK